MTADPRDWLRRAVTHPPPAQMPVENDRKSAVLLPVLRRGSGPTLLFVRKSQHLAKHAGQVGFPGGAIDPADASVEAAALREAWEEVGLSAAEVELIGRLDEDRTFVTNYHIAPVVGWIDAPPVTWRIDSGEIEGVVEVELTEVVDRDPESWLDFTWAGVDYRAPRFAFSNGLVVWGASARILINLQRRLRGATDGPSG